MRAKPASSMSLTDSAGIRRASSAACARSAKRGASARVRSRIVSLVEFAGGAGACGICNTNAAIRLLQLIGDLGDARHGAGLVARGRRPADADRADRLATDLDGHA